MPQGKNYVAQFRPCVVQWQTVVKDVPHTLLLLAFASRSAGHRAALPEFLECDSRLSAFGRGNTGPANPQTNLPPRGADATEYIQQNGRQLERQPSESPAFHGP